MRFRTPVAAALAAAFMTGCAALPRERGYADADALVHARLARAPDWQAHLEATEAPQALPEQPLSRDAALELAFARNPRVAAAYARLGLGRAELEQARRLANPRLGFSRIAPRGGSDERTRSLSFGLGDLLLLPARTRLANAELASLEHQVADDLLALAHEVERAWYGAVAASQSAAMRALIADAAGASAELAQRFFEAGNIQRLQLEQELAAASQARIAAARARAAALRARSALAGLLGVRADAAWQVPDRLPAPHAVAFDAETLTRLALEQRLDLAAARRDVAQREDALGVVRRWRWLGDVELGAEREREADGEIKRGPTLALSVPLFDQGQGKIARAQAQLLAARAALDARVLDVQNDVRRDLDRLAVMREIADGYRDALVPYREAIVARTQEQVNYMLRGVFELIAARQDGYDAYAEYLTAVRDYWLAHADLRYSVGGKLPDDGAREEATLGIDAILPAPENGDPSSRSHGDTHGRANDGHDGMHEHKHAPGSAGAASPSKEAPSSAHDPHAAHGSGASGQSPSPKTPPDDPHAAHRHHDDNDAGAAADAHEHDHH